MKSRLPERRYGAAEEHLMAVALWEHGGNLLVLIRLRDDLVARKVLCVGQERDFNVSSRTLTNVRQNEVEQASAGPYLQVRDHVWLGSRLPQDAIVLREPAGQED